MSLKRAGSGRTIGPARTINDPLLPALHAAQLADSPLGLWSCQDPSGSTATDVSGNGRHGTYVSATLAQSAINSNGSYAVTAGRIDIAYASWMNVDSWTLEVLVYPTDVSGNKSPAGRNSTVAHGILWLWNSGGGNNYFYGTNGSPTVSPNGATGLSVNTPYLLAAKWDKAGGTCSIWRNGTSAASASNSGASADQQTSGGLNIGDSTAGSYPWAGKFAYAAYYGTALSDARLLAHAQAAGLA